MTFKSKLSTVQVSGGMPSIGVRIGARRVFAVTGEDVLRANLWSIQPALTCSERREPGTMPITTLTGPASIACMTVVKFIIRSEFRGLIATSARPRAVSVALHGLERNQS